jgi:predicted RND superfamily exporter protein
MLELIDEIFGPTNGKKEGLSVHVTGSNLVAARALSKLVEDMLFSLGTAFVVISLLMMVLLRSFRIGLLSMLPNMIPLLMCVGFMGWVGIPIRTSTALIFSVALGVAVNDTIHFVTRFREELFRTGDRKEAVRRTIMSTGRAIMFTSIVMIFGFGTMMTTNFVGIFQMGLLGVVTLSAALLGDLLLLPVMLVVFRPWERFIEKKQREGTWKPVELG